ncbi:unnamed protein product [Lota lota]
MQSAWALTSLSAVVCTAACMVLFGQYALWTKLSGDEEQQKIKHRTFDATFNEKQFIKNTMQNQLDQQRINVIELEGERQKATLEQQQKAADLDFCKADKKKKNQELADTEKEEADAKDNLSKVSAAWAEQIASLKQVKVQPSKICAFIKKDSIGAKLCMPEATAPAAVA